jgi:hypothetical protein
MRPLIGALWLGAVLILAAVIGGCGSGGVGSTPDLPGMGKIREYVGDGGGSLKPWPAMLPAPNAEQPQALGTMLTLGANFLTNSVPRYQTNWYRLAPVPTKTIIVVTLQPTANEDSDLYVCRGGVYEFEPHAYYGYSVRLPSVVGGDGVDGYAPDWVAFTRSPTAGPAAQVAVFGGGTAGTKHYRIEADAVALLPLTGAKRGGTLPPYDSHWYRFHATSGTAYSVHLQTVDEDPDIYVYQDAATEFVGKAVLYGAGHETVAFTASETVYHYVRVHAWGGGGSGSAQYKVWVTSP